MDASVNKEEKSTQNINQVIKEALFKMSDPTPDMTDEERESYHRKLLAKLESGQKLTSQELAFLRTNDPAAYQKARRMEQKRQWLTEQMKKCKSKQEVSDVVSDAIAHVSEKDPDRNAIIATYREAYKEFRKTPGYCRLPDTRKEAEEEEKRGKKRQYAGDIDSASDVTPLAEVYDALPVFDAKG